MRLGKDWDRHVVHAEDVARTPGFAGLRDMLVTLADPGPADVVVDVGAGTGLLSLTLAERTAHVWAVDISRGMCEYLQTKAASAGRSNVVTAVASATSLPLVDGVADLVVSNYCFHHLRDADKERAVLEVERVLRPGGRFVMGDVMFRLGGAQARDREIARATVRRLLSRGVPGAARLLRHAARQLAGQGEHPAAGDWWTGALERAGFVEVRVEELAHEGGIATAQKPGREPARRRALPSAEPATRSGSAEPPANA